MWSRWLFGVGLAGCTSAHPPLPPSPPPQAWAPAQQIVGSNAERLGVVIAGLGDVNGDGLADVAVTASGGAGQGMGCVRVYHGSSAGLLTPAALELCTTEAYDGFGRALAGPGDVDGDGFSDLAIGVSGHDSNRGRVLLHPGSPGGILPDALSVSDGPAGVGRFGEALDGAGDVNGDGFVDVVVGAPDLRSNAGGAGVLPGGPTGLATSWEAPTYGISSSRLGTAVAGLGDLDGDGYDDIALGAPEGAQGTVLVLRGSPAGPAARVDLSGSVIRGRFGTQLAGGHDLDGDGRPDLAVHARGTGPGQVMIFAGTEDGVDTTASLTLRSTPSDSSYGEALDMGDDLDGDGLADLVVGMEDARGGPGRVQLLPGVASPPLAPPTTWLVSTGLNDDFGLQVRSVGDLNGDGLGDLVAGASEHDALSGRIDVYLGRVDLDHDGEPAGLDCDDEDPAVGAAPAWVDADDDGFGEAGASVPACAGPPAGYVTNADDCDDSRPDVSPHGQERCDFEQVDEDCDGLVNAYDDSADRSVVPTGWLDVDGDGFGDDGVSLSMCSFPIGYVAVGGDCDDRDPARHPDADERCQPADLDDDCDGLIDEADPDLQLAPITVDADGDGFGAEQARAACDQTGDPGVQAGDCDDDDALTFPGAPEIAGDGVDQDCSGADSRAPSAEDDKEEGCACDQRHGGGWWALLALAWAGASPRRRARR